MNVFINYIYFPKIVSHYFLLPPQEFRASELLRSGLDRSKYLLVKEAKIIAMTCTHAALKRHDLVKLGFKVKTYILVPNSSSFQLLVFCFFFLFF